MGQNIGARPTLGPHFISHLSLEELTGTGAGSGQHPGFGVGLGQNIGARLAVEVRLSSICFWEHTGAATLWGQQPDAGADSGQHIGILAGSGQHIGTEWMGIGWAQQTLFVVGWRQHSGTATDWGQQIGVDVGWEHNIVVVAALEQQQQSGLEQQQQSGWVGALAQTTGAGFSKNTSYSGRGEDLRRFFWQHPPDNWKELGSIIYWFLILKHC